MLEVKPTGQRGRMAEMGGAYRFAASGAILVVIRANPSRQRVSRLWRHVTVRSTRKPFNISVSVTAARPSMQYEITTQQ